MYDTERRKRAGTTSCVAGYLRWIGHEGQQRRLLPYTPWPVLLAMPVIGLMLRSRQGRRPTPPGCCC